MALRIGHIDIVSKDPGASADFYERIFGWEIERNDELGYTGFTDGSLSGGFPDLRHGFEPVRRVLEEGDVLCYVEVEDLEGTLAAAVAHGGEVLLEKTEAAPGDYLGIFRDPAGVKFAVSSCDRYYDR
jgi:predicted enzyme related to lactoylglutathione lyase